MAEDKKISQLTVASALTGTETLEVVQGGVNKQTTTQGIANLAGGGVTSVNGETGAVTGFAKTVDVVGIQDLFIPASAMWPTVTTGCAALAQTEIATSLANIQTLDFDQTTEEHCQFQIVLPRKWNNSFITFKAYWTASAGTPGQTVRWQMNGASYSDDAPLTNTLGSSVAVDDTLLATGDVHISDASPNLTISQTPASEDFLILQVHRGVGSDDLAADAKLLGVSLRITTTAAKDA